MGGNIYSYFTAYNADIQAALDALRNQEFIAGRYEPALTIAYESLPPGSDFLSPGAQHNSIEEAFQDAGEDGTGSILDIFYVSLDPGFLYASPFSEAALQRYFGTTKPRRIDIDQAQQDGEFFDEIGRGQARYVVVHEQATPSEIFFVGCSID